MTLNGPLKKVSEAFGQKPLARHDTVQQPELFEPDAHRDRRHKEALGKRPGEAIQHPIFIVVEIATDLDSGMFDRRFRLQNALLAVGKRLVPSGKDHLARHQQARSVVIRLPLHPLLGLA
ncbi:hypothetical protein [Tepidamorphus gemmatus]|uniref:hypothetical protein n=1 Tax=Tepidamorphus gemmatus TaxID=747076 RepID=UPI001FDF48CB|nr:hypothetical protein [Tepidamorphus gemmatus]